MSAGNAFASLPCELEQFKQGVAEFTKAAPTCDFDSLENGKKAVALMYLGLPDDPLTTALAVSYFEYAMRRYLERLVQLQIKEVPA